MKRLILLMTLALIAPIALAAPASADHKWSKYHWPQKSTPLTLTIVDSTDQSSPWKNMLATARQDWNDSPFLTLQSQTGTYSSSCDPISGKIRVCNDDYGSTGWLGVAQIWIYVGKGGHIAQATTKVNDYYFSGAGSIGYAYDNTAEMQHVVCQEVGHDFGLDHQSETSASLDTCMDYYHNTGDSDLKSTHPNQGDIDELQCLYDPASKGVTISSNIDLPGGGSYTHTCTGSGHLDTSSKPGGGGGGGGPGGGPPGGGPGSGGRPTVIVSQVGQFWLVTFIHWN